ncbi:GNAT family N-acetyltransferase [Chloroflexota bacterium]
MYNQISDNCNHQEVDIGSLRIEGVTAENLAEIIHLAELVWWDHFPGIISDEQIEYMLSKGYTEDKIIRELESGTVCWVTLLDGSELVGFASYGPVDNGEEMQLHKLYVHPGFQWTGYGTAVLHYIQKKAAENGYKYLVLAVNKNNEKAISAYLKNGFVITESRITDIGNGFFMDDYIMSKYLIQ